MRPSASVYEKAKAEVDEARTAFAKAVEPFVSQDWILRNVFRLTEEEISRRNLLDDFIRQVSEGA